MKTDTRLIEMTERLVKLETDVVYIKENVSATNEKLTSFIDCVDTKYATKNVENIAEENKKAINNINVKLAKYAGCIGVIMMIIQYLASKFL